MRKWTTDDYIFISLWITMGVLAACGVVWYFLLGQPAISGCYLFKHFHIYCPGCGGTRATEALLRGQALRSLWYNPAVLYVAGSVGAYLMTQTVWRLGGRRGRWVLRYQVKWLYALLLLLAVNCLARNILWLGWGIGLS